MANLNIEKIYDEVRYTDQYSSNRYTVFNVLCKYYFDKLIPKHGDDEILIDIAAGHCDFVNNIAWKGRKYAFDLNEYSKRTALPKVKVIADDVLKLNNYFAKNSGVKEILCKPLTSDH